LAIQLHGSGTIVNSLVALFGARQTAGFYSPGYYCPNPETYLPWPGCGLEIHRLLALIDFLELPRAGDHLELPLEATDFAVLEAVLPAERLQRSTIVIHPGASVPQRRWPAEQFAAVADHLAEDDWRIVLTGVPSEHCVVADVAAAMTYPALNLCGQTNVGSLGALVSRARLVICNDTGISHIAAATNTPSVVISTGDNPARWSPIDRNLHRVLCHDRGVAVSEVLAAAQALLATQGDRTPHHHYRTELVSA
jgi:ADP-heptose:LPS heptosyltransferase